MNFRNLGRNADVKKQNPAQGGVSDSEASLSARLNDNPTYD